MNRDYHRFASQFVKHLNIDVSRKLITEYLIDNPRFPGVEAFESLFDKLHVKHAKLRVDVEQAQHLPTPFLALNMSFRPGSLAVIDVNDTGVTLIDWKGQQQLMELDAFCQTWPGDVLVVEPTAESGEENYLRNRITDLFEQLSSAVLLIGVLAVLLVLSPTDASKLTWFLLLSNFLGFIISLLLVIKTLNISNSYLDKVCSWSESVQCDAILTSTGARVLGLISWSEIGFIYFLSSFLIIYIHPTASTELFLRFITILQMPFVVYSITYQARAKSWCVLCLMVQGVFIIEFALSSAWTLIIPAALQLQASFLLFSGILILAGSAWVVVKPMLLSHIEAESLKRTVNSLKYNPNVFKQLLASNSSCVEQNIDQILFGNKDASTHILLVINPFCGKCAQAHQDLKDLLLRYGQALRVSLVFSINGGADQLASQAAKGIISYYQQEGPEATLEKLQQWHHRTRKTAAFWSLDQRGAVAGLPSADNVLRQHSAWCRLQGQIRHTPTVFLNGQRIPELYSLADLPYFI